MNYNKLIDHTALKADTKKENIMKLCQEAMEFDFASVCVNPTWVSYCAEILKNSDVKVCTVIGFPLGANTTATKVFETEDAINNGADEIDMVINIGALKDGDVELVYEDIKAVVEASEGHVVKVIIETCLLSDEEKIAACEAAAKAKASFVKTSTGFSTGGAKIDDVKQMKNIIGKNIKLKASGGIRTFDDAVKFIEAGADRLGCSASVAIMEEYNNKKISV